MNFVGTLLVRILQWLVDKTLSFLGDQWKLRREQEAIEKQAKEDAERLKKAKDIEEKKRALENIVDHTFHS